MAFSGYATDVQGLCERSACFGHAAGGLEPPQPLVVVAASASAVDVACAILVYIVRVSFVVRAGTPPPVLPGRKTQWAASIGRAVVCGRRLARHQQQEGLVSLCCCPMERAPLCASTHVGAGSRCCPRFLPNPQNTTTRLYLPPRICRLVLVVSYCPPPSGSRVLIAHHRPRDVGRLILAACSKRPLADSLRVALGAYHWRPPTGHVLLAAPPTTADGKPLQLAAHASPPTSGCALLTANYRAPICEPPTSGRLLLTGYY